MQFDTGSHNPGSVAVHLHAQYRAMLLDRGAVGEEVAAVHAPSDSPKSAAFMPDSAQAWVRLALALVIGSIGSVGMWSVVVVLPVVQAEFATTRGAVSLAFTLTMLGFGGGGVVTGRITDRFGIVTAWKDGAQHRTVSAAALCGARPVDHAVAVPSPFILVIGFSAPRR